MDEAKIAGFTAISFGLLSIVLGLTVLNKL